MCSGRLNVLGPCLTQAQEKAFALQKNVPGAFSVHKGSSGGYARTSSSGTEQLVSKGKGSSLGQHPCVAQWGLACCEVRVLPPESRFPGLAARRLLTCPIWLPVEPQTPQRHLVPTPQASKPQVSTCGLGAGAMGPPTVTGPAQLSPACSLHYQCSGLCSYLSPFSQTQAASVPSS